MGIDPLVDKEMISSIASAVQEMVNLRNKRDEGAHGHLHPLIESSHPRLEDFVVRTTEAITIYLIEVTVSCLSIELDEQEAEVEYEDPDNGQFNTEYDELIEASLIQKGVDPNDVYYNETPSYALFALDPKEYVQLLENWRDQNNPEGSE